MATKLILLYDIPGPMFIVQCPSGVIYRNQVGGLATYQEELEGVLSPLDLSDDIEGQLEAFPYPQGRRGITVAIADAIDALLASRPGANFLKVDRARLSECWEAWVHVLIDTPERDEQSLSGPYFGPVYGFGTTTGVLTWPNSD